MKPGAANASTEDTATVKAAEPSKPEETPKASDVPYVPQLKSSMAQKELSVAVTVAKPSAQITASTAKPKSSVPAPDGAVAKSSDGAVAKSIDGAVAKSSALTSQPVAAPKATEEKIDLKKWAFGRCAE